MSVAPELEIEEGGAPKKKGGKKKLIMLVLLLGLLGGGFFVKGKMAGGKKGTKEAVKAEPGPKVDLGDEMIINLQGGGYLRIKLAVELKAGTEPKAMEEEMAPMRDAAIRVFGSRTRAELLTEKGKEKGKSDLIAQINADLGKPLVQKVFYTYFAMQ